MVVLTRGFLGVMGNDFSVPGSFDCFLSVCFLSGGVRRVVVVWQGYW